MVDSIGRAKAGGQNGINGEWYDGGQFLPSSPNTVKGAQKIIIRKGSKREVAPYVWEECPADDMLSIYDRIHGWCTDNRRECEYVKGLGLIGFKFIKEYDTHRDSYGKDFRFEEPVRAWIADLIERFNSGERWYPLEIDPLHYLNQ